MPVNCTEVLDPFPRRTLEGYWLELASNSKINLLPKLCEIMGRLQTS